MVRRGPVAMKYRWLGIVALWQATLWAQAPPGESGEALFARRIRPILEQSCVKCHHPGARKGGLDLTPRAGLVRGGESGPAIRPGQGRQSLLYQVVAHQTEPHMPHRSPRLADDDVEAIRRWIDLGAPYAGTLTVSVPETHWSFRPLRRPAGASIDQFIDAALRAKGIARNPPASRAVLIRRIFMDLIGLPPEPEEVDAFIKDSSPDAYARLVDRLLESPHYGERWAGHWLDLARYADSGGFENDFDRPWAWPYRDFVIGALNQDLPYDTFVRWQLAGDLLDPDRPDAVAATGFLAAGPRVWVLVSDTEQNRERYRYDHLDDVLSTAGSAMLGLTIGCARCHDHKYDPIRQREYYRLLATFQSFEITDRAIPTPQRKLEDWLYPRLEAIRLERIAALKLPDRDKDLLRRELDRISGRQKKLHETHGPKVNATADQLAERLSPEERSRLAALQADASGVSGEIRRVLAVRETHGDPPKSYVLEGGDAGRKKEEVSPGFLEALPTSTIQGPPRAALAAWMTELDRGAGALLARVIVNRLWHSHFGEGLVRTPSDFGSQGDPPVHRELLEWLASELVAHGWRLKPIHRLILTSAAYGQTCDSDPRRRAVDPENRLWWRRRPLRMDAEMLRDSVLAVSGRLDRRLHGAPVRAPIPAEAIVTRSQDPYPGKLQDTAETWRRSIYLFRKRSVPVPLMEMFDAPSPVASCGRRNASTVAPQALTLLNDPFLRGCAEDLARRTGTVDAAFQRALGRPPTAVEREAARAFTGEKLVDLCQALFCLNEFIYVD